MTEFLAMCRNQDCFNISDIKYAIIETTGQVSILPTDDKNGVICSDLKFSPQAESIVANVILDGQIMHSNLKAIGLDTDWAYKRTKKSITVKKMFFSLR